MCFGLMYDRVDVYSVVWVVSLFEMECICFGDLEKGDVIWILKVKFINVIFVELLIKFIFIIKIK